ncbi:hypothetical protein OG840_24135 [Streptomyces sp. NBC_01764]|jgi:hypothetical protein|uniref:hypothetical protein n=1 Tax=Streptomyces sp. NBC_01764 TaxID=2975935 RepID=UPI00224CF28B|nr:hypothetical protein [Streptomyces sp. NBC_01764]MCX4404647.1 hypothetical protein [Streptomyces sp. NBC_01764]
MTTDVHDQGGSPITSTPGLGSRIGTEFLATTDADMTALGTADHPAGFGIPRDFGKISSKPPAP